MNNFLITVRIADREYRLKIDKKEEETIRNAARQINENINTYAENFEYKDKQDLLAMVVLQHATNAIKLEEQVEFQEKQLFGKLEEINKVLSEKLSKI